MGLTKEMGRQGLILDPGQRFRVDLTNALDEEMIIHWHGQIPSNAQDGMPNLPMPLLQQGEMRSYDYAPMPATHWMHSHVPVQEMDLLAAPLIVRRIDDLAETDSGAFDIDLAQERLLWAVRAEGDPSLVLRPVDRAHMIVLGGAMQHYLWTIYGQTWGSHTPHLFTGMMTEFAVSA